MPDETSHPPHPVAQVMVSSTFTDLKEHRAALIGAIHAHGMHAKVMENDSARLVDVITSSLQMVRVSAAYIGVVSLKYGQTPESPTRNPEKLSITELEFNEAQRLGRPILLFIMGDKHPVTKADIERDPDKEKKLDAFRERAKKASLDSSVNRVYAVFNSLEEFKDKMNSPLAELEKHLNSTASAIEKDTELPPFTVVDRNYLAKARMVERKRFLFEPPEWHHVVHGADEQLKFVERDQTAALAQAVREQLIAPLLRGTGNLSALFVTGPPGAGKSTLVRRVAAQLIEAGEVVVADAGHNLANTVPGGVEPYVQQLTKLAQRGRPVLLVLDDPLSAESEWIELLKQLKQPGLQLAVITPTPDFLYHSHQHALRGVQILTFSVNPPSAAEKQALTRLYGRALDANEPMSDDFLVMVAEAAEGNPFPVIMQRLWATLNGGQGISGNLLFKELPWPVRAFWFVCTLHRTYTPCPLPILQAALDMSGGTDRFDVPTALTKLKAEGNWSIFLIIQPAHSLLRAAGELVSTAHQKIASVAWEKRPGAWLDGEVNRLLAAATLRVPASMLYVASAAGTMTKAAANPDSNLAEELMKQWEKAATEDRNLETRAIYTLVKNLTFMGGPELVQRMIPLLQQRANGRDGWIATLALRYLSAEKEVGRSFPRTINLEALIAEADFSIAPKRATQFFNAVKEKQTREAIFSRLCASLDGTLEWQIDSTLLTWLISSAPQSKMTRKLPRLKDWLEAHEEDTSVRAQYLAFLMKLPREFAEQRKKAATATENWLARHHDDTYVRTQYLAFLMKLPEEFAEQRKQAANETANWLAQHKENTDVRTQYLAFLMKLPEEFAEQRKQAANETAEWLAQHKESTDVRAQYLAFLMKLPEEFAEQRKNAATATEIWLAEHDGDTNVRTQYLAFVQQLPRELDEMRKQAALKTAEWLKKYPEDFSVSTGYVRLLLALHHPDLATLEAESIPIHQKIIEKNPKQVGYRFTFGEQLRRLGRYVEAKAEYEQILAREPWHQLAHRGVAMAWQNLGEPQKAESEFKDALYWAKKNGGSLARIHTPLGEFYLQEKRWHEAIHSFQAAGKEYPDYYGNHWGIAKAQSGLGKVAEARQSLERALADPGLRSPDKDKIEHMLADISR